MSKLSRFFQIKLTSLLLILVMTTTTAFATTTPLSPNSVIPDDIQKIMMKPIYKDAEWGLRVIDRKTKEVLLNLNSTQLLYIGSARKIFSIGELLNEKGAQYRTTTTVHMDGKINQGNLKGNLVLVASGDLTMGGRTKSNGEIAVTDLDHNEADLLGNAELVTTNPLAGYEKLAQQIKQFGINKISGDVIIDARLFDPFNFRNEFNVSPIFVNDDVIDVSIYPGLINKNASVKWRPQSAAFHVLNHLMTVGDKEGYRLELNPATPSCIGKPNCYSEITGELPLNYHPSFTNTYPLVQIFRITQPANFARSIFIEALQKAGVDVSDIGIVKENPTQLLKPRHFYNPENQVAFLQSLPYAEHAKLILKVSYNIGADTSLVLWGLTKGVRNIKDSLRVEKEFLEKKFDIPSSDFTFADGSGGGETKATNTVVTTWLDIMTKSPAFDAFFAALPILGVDGSLSLVKDFQMDKTLAGATGHVHAKTGTYIAENNQQIFLKCKSLAGYIDTKKDNSLIFEVVVNNVVIHSINDMFDVSQDLGSIAATLWRDY